MTQGYYRFPTISHDRVAFVSEDDLWSVPVCGGVAQRLTSNLGEVSHPLFSPDGAWLAFIGREEGTSEVYVMPAEGGAARRLTFLGSSSRVLNWTPDSQAIVFSSSYGQPPNHDPMLYSIPASAQNGIVTTLPYGLARSISFGPHGSVVLGRNVNDPAHWKRYRGGKAGHLWIDRQGTGDFIRLLPDFTGNVAAPMWIEMESIAAAPMADRIFFLSDHEGVGNLYSCTIDGEDLRRHTDHDDFYVRNPTTDGKQIVYHLGGNLFVFDIAGDTTRQLTIDYHSSRTQRNRKFVDPGRYFESARLHPSGKAMTLTTRGKLYSFFNHEGPVLQLGVRDGVRYRLPEWFADGRILVVSDEQGEETLEIRTNHPNEPVWRLEGEDIGRVNALKISPNEDKVAITNHRHELLLIDLSEPKEGDDGTISARLTRVDVSPHAPISGFDWSPDGRWLAYGFHTTNQTAEIRLYHLEDASANSATANAALPDSTPNPIPNPIAITRPVLRDVRPAFDPEGRYLYFLSYREFNPIYDNLHFDVSFPWGMRPYVVLLRNDLPNPFIPRPDLDEEEGREAPAKPPPAPPKPAEGEDQDKPAHDDSDQNDDPDNNPDNNPDTDQDNDGDPNKADGENGSARVQSDAANAPAADSKDAASSDAQADEPSGEQVEPLPNQQSAPEDERLQHDPSEAEAIGNLETEHPASHEESHVTPCALDVAPVPGSDEAPHRHEAYVVWRRYEVQENGAVIPPIIPETTPPTPVAPSSRNAKAAPPSNAPVRKMRIDLAGITERVLAFPVPDGRYQQIMGIPGKALFTSYDVQGLLDQGHSWDDDHRSDLPTLRCYNFKDYRSELLIEGVSSFDLSRNRKKLLYSTGRRLRVINAGERPPNEGGSSRRTGWIDLHRVKVSVLPQQEWEQMFREAWRLQRDHFWSEDMSQVDWHAIYAAYFPLIQRVSTRSEFSDLMWEMQGELGTSHAYESGGDYRPRPYFNQGFLGTSFSWDAEAKGYRLQEILTGDPWDVNTNSPLTQPGLDIQEGDLLQAINGQRLSEQLGPAQLLVNQAGYEVLLNFAERATVAQQAAGKSQESRVSSQESAVSSQESRVKSQESTTDEQELTVAQPSGPADALVEQGTATPELPPAVSSGSSTPPRPAPPASRFYVVRTMESESEARYRAWVNGNQKRVHQATAGRIGYLHIPDMTATGYAEFHRGYLAEITREGLIVDVRNNSGGHVSQLILEKLARRRLGYEQSRWSTLHSFPSEIVSGPMVALMNENAGSDGDIFCHSFRLLKLGPLIGKRTWGGVIGIAPHHSLVDGTVTTQPEYSYWFTDVGWNLENYGVDPDIEVDITPQEYAAGKDPQLERAITEVLNLLAKNPLQKPQLGPRPNRSIPKLPPREPSNSTVS